MTDPVSELDALMAFTRQFETAQAHDPALADASLDELLRHVPGKRAVLRGRFDGQPAVFRLFAEPDAAIAQREWAEIMRIWPEMQDDTLRIARPLHHAPAYGVLVTEAIEGTPLLQHLYNLPPEERAGMMQGPARWLRRYTRPTEKPSASKADIWLERAKTQSGRQTHAKLQRRERKLLKHLTRLQGPAMAQDWRFAICHGDFHPNNLIYDPPRLTGIDLGGSAMMPIYKDIARFLMHMGRRGMHPSGQARFGVDAEGLDAFCTSFDLSDWEHDIVLPFMLGIEALIRVEAPSIGRSRVRRAAGMYDQLIADLAQI